MPHYSYNGNLPVQSSPYTNGTPSILQWTNQVNIQPQLRKPLVPNGTINDRTLNGPFRVEYNPYFWAEYKNNQIY